MKIWGKNKGVWWCENSVWHVSSFIQPFCNTVIITLSLWGLAFRSLNGPCISYNGGIKDMRHPVKNLICLTVWHISVLFWPPRGSRKCRTSLTGVVRQRLHGFSRRLKICREAKRDWHNFKESLIRLSKSSECPVHSTEYGYPLASAKFG